MPIAVFQTVREVSSEDAVHVAANLLKEQAGKKWRTQQPGEKSAYVILEFAEPQQISGLDIGNEHAAFIEVLVSRSGCQPQDFKELLLSSSFMTPIESKNSSNTNRVRCFNNQALDTQALTEKWKLVKIVCTQPFNKHVRYGLSFIKVHVVGSAEANGKPKSLVPDKFMQFGRFKMREESTDSESESQVALFQRWKDQRTETTTAAAIRDASTSSGLSRLSTHKPSPLSVSPLPSSSSKAKSQAKTENKPLDRNRESLLFGEDPEEEDKDLKKQRLSKHIEADKNRRRLEQEKQEQEKTKKKTPSRPPKRLSSSALEDNLTPAKKAKKEERQLQYRPFDRLMEGVVLVISGIQNPDRADLRAKAVALGAKYKADWETGCTHLICAFKNTPKYNQVRGKGKIVTRSWIEKSYALKKYLPWRRYALDTAELGQPESDEELSDESLRPTTVEAKADNDDDVIMVPQIIEAVDMSSGMDTEDELERVAQENKLKKNLKTKSRDVFEVSTDEEDYLEQKKQQIIETLA